MADLARVDSDAYQAVIGDALISIDRVYDSSREGLSGEVKVNWNAQPNPRLLLASTRITFARAGWHRSVLPVLEKAVKNGPDWQQVLTEVFQEVIDTHRRGPELRPVNVEVKSSAKYLVKPLVAASGATVIAAMGGTGKGWYAVGLALTVCTGRSVFLGAKPLETLPVVYFDYEDSWEYFIERVTAACVPHGVPVPDEDMMMHATPDGPMHAMIDGHLRDLHRRGIRKAFFVVDSRGAAAGTDVNESAGTNMLYDAVHRLPGPSLIIDHLSWEAARKKRDGSIGSVYGWNRPRMIWNAEAEPTSEGFKFAVRNPKFNRGRRQDPRAWNLLIESADDEDETLRSVAFKPIPASTVTSIVAENPTNHDLVYVYLSRSDEPQAVADIAGYTGLSPNSINTVFNRDKEGEFTSYKDGRRNLYWLKERDQREALPDPM